MLLFNTVAVRSDPEDFSEPPYRSRVLFFQAIHW
jgi:hypothetical protein